MEHRLGKPSLWLWVVVALVVLALVGALLSLSLLLDTNRLHYPGAERVSQHATWSLAWRPWLRQDASYRTEDPFPAVYNWYSNGFNLGPESRAMSRCILIENTEPVLILTIHMSVMVCDTSSARRVFIERTISLR